MSSTPKKGTTKAASANKTAAKKAHSPAPAPAGDVPPPVPLGDGTFASPAVGLSDRREVSRILADARERGQRARREDPDLVEFLENTSFQAERHAQAHVKVYEAAQELLRFANEPRPRAEPERRCCRQLAELVMNACVLSEETINKYSDEIERRWHEVPSEV